MENPYWLSLPEPFTQVFNYAVLFLGIVGCAIVLFVVVRSYVLKRKNLPKGALTMWQLLLAAGMAALLAFAGYHRVKEYQRFSKSQETKTFVHDEKMYF